MPKQSLARLEPRKSPVQARSAASVQAILEATIQVLLRVGKDRLTTTRVAMRAGVSVGTLYQYFPNKSALLQAVLRNHLDGVTRAVEQVCREQTGKTSAEMSRVLVTRFLEAKLKNPEASVALYSVSADVDGARIAQQSGARSAKAIARMLETASEPLHHDPQLAGVVLQAAMAGVSRSLLESYAPAKRLSGLRQELIILVQAYLQACSTVSAGLPPFPDLGYRETNNVQAR